MDSTGHKYAECTRHGQKEDEKQSGREEPAKLDPGIERKQQTQIVRPRMAIHLSNEILRDPARIVVEKLLLLKSDLSTLNTLRRSSLSQDARVLLEKCQVLHRSLLQSPACPGLEGYACYLKGLLFDRYSRDIVQRLSYDTRLKLTLIAWHFDGCGIDEFLRSPIDKEAWETLHASYQAQSHQQVPYEDFKHSFDFLLLPQLAPSQQHRNHPVNRPESGHSPYQRQDLYITPGYPVSSSSPNLQHFRAYKDDPDNYGRSYPIHHGQTAAGGQDKHAAEALPRSQSTTPLPRLRVSSLNKLQREKS